MRAIAFPFRIDTYGRLMTTDDPSKIYLDRLYTLLSTMANSRPMNPDYGTDLFRSLYETGQNESAALPHAIKQAVNQWLPMLVIESISVSDTNMDGQVKINVEVSLPDSTTGTVSVYKTNALSVGM